MIKVGKSLPVRIPLVNVGRRIRRHMPREKTPLYYRGYPTLLSPALFLGPFCHEYAVQRNPLYALCRGLRALPRPVIALRFLFMGCTEEKPHPAFSSLFSALAGEDLTLTGLE